MLKSLDFQERMGLVTRTISRAAEDLTHFMLLVGIIFFSYVIVENLLFGHQYEVRRSLEICWEVVE